MKCKNRFLLISSH